MYGKKDSIVNNNMVSSSCSHYNDIESWSHIIQCSATHNLIDKQIENLQMKLIKTDYKKTNKTEIVLITNDIKQYLYGHQPSNTNQAIIGYINLFQGFIVKTQIGTSNNSEYEAGLDKYTKGTIIQSNTMKLNNFGKHYKIHTEALKQ